MLNVFLLQKNGKYDEGVTYEWGGQIPVHIFQDHPIDLEDIFGS